MELSLSSSIKGWQVSLGPFRAIADDSLIFDFSKAGNIEMVQLLFNRREASVLDTNSKGWTPLHVSNDLCSCSNHQSTCFLITNSQSKFSTFYTQEMR